MGCSASPQKPVSYAFYTLGTCVKLSLCSLEVVVVVRKISETHHNCSRTQTNPHPYTLKPAYSPSPKPNLTLRIFPHLFRSLTIKSNRNLQNLQTLPLKSNPIQAPKNLGARECKQAKRRLTLVYYAHEVFAMVFKMKCELSFQCFLSQNVQTLL